MVIRAGAENSYARQQERRRDGYRGSENASHRQWTRKFWQQSRHLPYYAEDMYSPLDIDGENYYLRPMNCPHHHLIYGATRHSYRELPMRIAEYAQDYRYEASGGLSGLMRVRGFCQNDAHIYCRHDQARTDEFDQRHAPACALLRSSMEIPGTRLRQCRRQTVDPAGEACRDRRGLGQGGGRSGRSLQRRWKPARLLHRGNPGEGSLLTGRSWSSRSTTRDRCRGWRVRQRCRWTFSQPSRPSIWASRIHCRRRFERAAPVYVMHRAVPLGSSMEAVYRGVDRALCRRVSGMACRQFRPES